SFNDLWLGRLPRMTLATNRAFNVYTDPRELEVSCKVSGIYERRPMVRFEVVDIEGRPIAANEMRLEEKATDEATDGSNADNKVFGGDAKWKPEIKEPGFYRIRCTLNGTEGLILERQQTLVVVEPAFNPSRGEYGWTLPNGDRPLSLSALEKLLPQVGIN